MSTTPGAAAGGLLDPSSLPLEVQMEIGAKMILGADPVKNFAPYILGMWFDAILVGALIMIAAKWKQHTYESERGVNRALVYYLVVYSIGVSCYILAYQIFLFAGGFGVYKNFLNARWSRVFYTLNACSRLPAATFFAHRAWMLMGKSNFVPIVMAPLLLSSIACAIAATSVSTNIPINDRENAFVIAFLSTEVMADLVNTATIAAGLFRRRSGWKSTDRLILRLLVIVAETQLPPTIIAVAFLITYVGWRDATAISIFVAAAKVHVICLVVVLNNRIKMKSDFPSSGNFERSYKLQDRPVVTVNTYTHTDAGEEKPFPHAKAGADGRTVNGRSVGGDPREYYAETDSKSSLV